MLVGFTNVTYVKPICIEYKSEAYMKDDVPYLDQSLPEVFPALPGFGVAPELGLGLLGLFPRIQPGGPPTASHKVEVRNLEKLK